MKDVETKGEPKAKAEKELVSTSPIVSGEENNHEAALEVGSKGLCKPTWKEDEWLRAEVIDTKRDGNGWTYYVHYESCNRRLDEWVSIDRVDLQSFKSTGDEAGGKKSASGLAGKKLRKVSKKGLKRKHADSLGGAGPEKKDDRSKDEKEHEEATKVKNIDQIQIGMWEMETWYYSPFPPEYADCRKLFICEFCLKFMRTEEALARHLKRCPHLHPPGTEIYRKDKVCVYEVDGAKNRMYCQNICYIAKLFLDHKTLYYDVNPFWFYVMCEVDSVGARIVGYFSKEKHSEEDFNVACILTLPSHQRKGYGKFLIDFSYELSKIEQKPGSPEKPLSDLGLLGYRSYWSQILVELLRGERTSSAISIQDICDRTMMKTEDIIATLQVLDIIQYYEGQHIIDLRRVNNLKIGSRGLRCDPSLIKWTPKSIGETTKRRG
uniref:histone acetyltransferase n=2 Tax=Rhodosorus marinus TaxID=101924 RepID=A0A7S3E6V0_9RHOD|mmetsp:Transcript_10287/g.43001  ORF Transcript_10287/g.43001 Transcript_10287/m.43001 type:complete len:435 (+) Transcript_10287:314-1618(+)|eukprot:CAMPEP_0113966124 /NCGR_PEP_ID=MMETSP0011_2-20120614/8150_1 /TAXON_ID=101924 /ORGANISM="Rhodosorus marinus" /LENGTH=434 /DNA_ID=CAMNT_0000978761 /DNA_START=204 /DNA_END=1508 /DNA_ORIENTATION=+ /assembly_acc=CAM_ASM_000156